MLTQEDLQQIGQLFDKKMDEKLTPIQKDIMSLKDDVRSIKDDVKTVDMKVETVLEYQKKAQSEIMEKIFDSNEANSQEVKKLEKRTDRIEKHLALEH
jgi:hypothetical protein